MRFRKSFSDFENYYIDYALFILLVSPLIYFALRRRNHAKEPIAKVIPKPHNEIDKTKENPASTKVKNRKNSSGKLNPEQADEKPINFREQKLRKSLSEPAKPKRKISTLFAKMNLRKKEELTDTTKSEPVCNQQETMENRLGPTKISRSKSDEVQPRTPPQSTQQKNPLYLQLKEVMNLLRNFDQPNIDFHVKEIERANNRASDPQYGFVYDYYFLAHSLRLLSLLIERAGLLLKNNPIEHWRNFIRHTHNSIIYDDARKTPYAFITRDKLACLTTNIIRALKEDDEKARCLKHIKTIFGNSYPPDERLQEIKNISKYENEIKIIDANKDLSYEVKRDSILYILSLLGNLHFSYNRVCDKVDTVSVNRVYRYFGHRGFNYLYNEFADDLYQQTALPLIKTIIKKVNAEQLKKYDVNAPVFKPAQTTPQVYTEKAIPTFFGSDTEREPDAKLETTSRSQLRKSH